MDNAKTLSTGDNELIYVQLKPPDIVKNFSYLVRLVYHPKICQIQMTSRYLSQDLFYVVIIDETYSTGDDYQAPGRKCCSNCYYSPTS